MGFFKSEFGVSNKEVRKTRDYIYFKIISMEISNADECFALPTQKGANINTIQKVISKAIDFLEKRQGARCYDERESLSKIESNERLELVEFENLGLLLDDLITMGIMKSGSEGVYNILYTATKNFFKGCNLYIDELKYKYSDLDENRKIDIPPNSQISREFSWLNQMDICETILAYLDMWEHTYNERLSVLGYRKTAYKIGFSKALYVNELKELIELLDKIRREFVPNMLL